MVQQGSTIEVFCCYAHEDKVFMDELKTHLGAFRKQNLIDIWDDGEIRAGAQWDQEIKEHLNKAGIILLLISPDFISSSYGYDTEMKRASERYGLKEAKIISVVLRPLNDWEKIPFGEITLGNLQALPTGARAVTMWENRDSAWRDVAKGIGCVIEELSPPPAQLPEVVAPAGEAQGQQIFTSPQQGTGIAVTPDQIQFTAFYPARAAVEVWNTLLVYVFLASALPNVQNDASLFRNELGLLPRTSQALSQYLLIRGTNLTIVPECRGVIFNPSSISFQWFEEWHRAAFRFRADMGFVGLASSGEISIYAGPLLIGMLKISLFFNNQGLPPAEARVEEHLEVTGGIYYQMFVSYSHKDTDVVKICRNIYRALGLTVLIDTDNLRSGQIWSNALERMIDTADVFQLFWSKHAATSRYVHQEWEYALRCNKGEGFIRPVYWKEPLVPPPPELTILHFAYLPPDTFGSLPRDGLPRRPSVIKKGVSIMGMVISFLFVLFGILGLFLGREGIFTNLWFWDLFFFLGLMIFFIAIIGWSPFFILKAGKTRAAIGKLIGIIAILLGVFITVVGAILASARPSSPDGAAGTIAGIISIIAGIVIWRVARIGIKNKP